MPVTPPKLRALTAAYNALQNTATDLVGAVAEIAPAAVGDIICRAGGLAELTAGPFVDFQGPGTGNRLLADIGGILQAACAVPPPLPAPPTGAPPFSGGQCPGVQYTVAGNVDYVPFDPSSETTSTTFLSSFRYGPISYIGDDGSPTSTGGLIRDFDFRGNPRETPLAGSSEAGTWTPTQLNITRDDGLPDDCGDPPPGPVPPRQPITQPPRSPAIPTEDDDGNPGPPIFFEPRIGPIFYGPLGEINVPVTVNVTGDLIDVDVSIPVTVSLPDFTVSFEYGGSGGTTGPGEPAEPTPPVRICCDPPPPVRRPKEEVQEEDEPIPPNPNSKIIGVAVASNGPGPSSSSSTIFTADPPLNVPRIATVQFQMESDNSVFVSADTQVKVRSQFVAAPASGTVVGATVKWEPGWVGSFDYVFEQTTNPVPVEPVPVNPEPAPVSP
uniref:Uncharacterized protein n=1 Tax=uncultured prokaryote TaxID=198431 RepID=A0A0H5QM37_9ZZZZ|nr:hypothetical protein [uncultured prokaryote]